MNAVETLTAEEVKQIKSFIALNRRSGWEYRLSLVIIGVVPVAFFVTARYALFKLPGYMESHGVALCLRHSTLTKGVVWWPCAPYMDVVLKGPINLLMLCAAYMALIVAGSYTQEFRARRAARVLERLYPQLAVEIAAPQRTP